MSTFHLGDPHPWQSARDKFDVHLMPELRRLGKQIGVAASAGDKNAAEVTHYYTLLSKSFDPCMMIYLETALNAWKEANL